MFEPVLPIQIFQDMCPPRVYHQLKQDIRELSQHYDPDNLSLRIIRDYKESFKDIAEEHDVELRVIFGVVLAMCQSAAATI